MKSVTVAEKTTDHDNVFFQRIQLYLIKLITVAEKTANHDNILFYLREQLA